MLSGQRVGLTKIRHRGCFVRLCEPFATCRVCFEGWRRHASLGLLAHSEAVFDGICRAFQFMQRGLDAETKQQLEEDHKRIISDEHWYLDLPELKAKE